MITLAWGVLGTFVCIVFAPLIIMLTMLLLTGAALLISGVIFGIIFLATWVGRRLK